MVGRARWLRSSPGPEPPTKWKHATGFCEMENCKCKFLHISIQSCTRLLAQLWPGLLLQLTDLALPMYKFRCRA
eukprot:927417-Amphidinium_carterae.1